MSRPKEETVQAWVCPLGHRYDSPVYITGVTCPECLPLKDGGRRVMKLNWEAPK